MEYDFSERRLAMLRQICLDERFLPSNFWNIVNSKNLVMLNSDGFAKFKRSVAQNYFNWLITKPWNNQFKNVFKFFLKNKNLKLRELSIIQRFEIGLITKDKNVKVGFWGSYFYKIFVGLVWNVALYYDNFELNQKLEEPQLGSPIPIKFRGKTISQDLANSIIECNFILENLEVKSSKNLIVEVGAGYGRLAQVFLSTQQCAYFIVDIPPALNVSEYYLTNLFPDKKFFEFREWNDFSEVKNLIESSDVIFLTPDQLSRFPNRYFDVLISVSTLPEMSFIQRNLFLEEFDRLSRGIIFLKQWFTWWNEFDKVVTSLGDYRFSDSWILKSLRKDPINSKFFNGVWSYKL